MELTDGIIETRISWLVLPFLAAIWVGIFLGLFLAAVCWGIHFAIRTPFRGSYSLDRW
jgi:hypothetical protein